VMHGKGGKTNFDKKDCIFTVAIAGSYTLANGTGAYAGISGHGMYHGTETAVFPRKGSGACATHATPAYELLVKAHGPVSLPS